MKYEMPVFILLIAWGLIIKRQNLNLRYMLMLFVGAWIAYSWLKG
ncbi:MAG: hypothetical protein NT023_23140 [Armatimonadetes bacterium]|nr:hypothetical protein [Armatimonadota bacterium]